MAGGRGERFWPLSRENTPKQLLKIVGKTTMIEETAGRLAPLVPPEKTWVVTNSTQAAAIRRLLPDVPRRQIIAEPVGRNTAPCIVLAALAIARRDPEGVMAVLPADHAISPRRTFRKTISDCAVAAEATGSLITIGVPPRNPATGYGYILRNKHGILFRRRDFYPVERFREKPDLKTARRLVKNPRYSWNSGMFVWKVSAILKAAEKHLPDIHRTLAPYRDLPARKAAGFLKKTYPTLPGISIDYGVMEKAENVLVTLAEFNWDDVGSWDALSEHLAADKNDNRARGPAAAINSSGCLTFSNGPLIATVDTKDLVVVATDDAVLVCPRGNSQEVKKLVDALRRRGKKEYL